MKKTILVFLVFAVLYSINGSGQSAVNYPALKQMIRDYNITCSLKDRDRKNNFKKLFINEKVPIYSEVDTAGYLKLFVDDYIEHFTAFFQGYDFDTVFIYDFNIKKVRPNDVLVVEFTKIIRFYDRDFNEEILDDTLEMILSYDAGYSKYLIVHVDKSEYLVPPGVGSGKLIPGDVSAKFSPSLSMLSNPELEHTNSFNWHASLYIHYLLAGKENFNFFINPGIELSGYNFTLSKSPFDLFLQDQVDKDEDQYTLNVHSRALEQILKSNFIGIPIDFEFKWKLNKFSLSGILGFKYSYPLISSISIANADMSYAGHYVFEGQDVVFDYLPDYGYKSYNKDDFSNIQTIELNQLIQGHLGILFNIPINKKLDLSFGPEYYFGFTDLAKSHVVEPLINDEEFISPNLLSFGDKSLLNSAGLSLNLTYHLQRPNYPYLAEIKSAVLPENKVEKKTSPCRTSSKESIRTQDNELAVFIEEDSDMPAGRKSYSYVYCGYSTAYSKKGSIRVGKTKMFDLKSPVESRKEADAALYIRKPYMVDLYSDSVESNADDEYFKIYANQFKKFNEENPLTIYSKQLPVLDIFYINNYYQKHEAFNVNNFRDSLYTWITSTPTGELHEILLFYAFDTNRYSRVMTYSNNYDAIDQFLDDIIPTKPEGNYNDFDEFKEFLMNVPCKRRDVNITYIAATPKTLDDYLPDLVESVYNYKLIENNENVTITIRVPWDKSYENDPYITIGNSIFKDKKLPTDYFDYRFKPYKF